MITELYLFSRFRSSKYNKIKKHFRIYKQIYKIMKLSLKISYFTHQVQHHKDQTAVVPAPLQAYH